MDEATTPAPDSPPAAPRWWRSRKVLGRVAIGLFVALGFVLFRPQVPAELAIVFAVPPTLYSGAASVPREAVERLDARFFGEAGAEIGRASVVVGQLVGPLTPPAPLRLPDGDYAVRVTARTAGGQEIPLGGRLTVDGDGTVRVELDRAK